MRQGEQDPFLHRVIEESPSGIITTDQDGLICHTNPAAARFLDVRIDELHGRKMSELDNPVARQLLALPVNGAQILGQWGRRRLRCSHSQFFDRGFPWDFYIIEDLTHELWDVEKQTYESLIRNLSHEINNAVGAANSTLHSALAYRGQLRPEDQDDLGSAIQVAVERMNSLNAFMRRYAEVIRVPLPSKRPTDILDLLERVIGRNKAECQDRDVIIELDIESHPTDPIALDVIQMEQVFEAVLRNACEATEERGSVRVSVGRQGKRTTVSIEDTGSGLTREAEKNLWTPFFSTKKDGQGVGLTLARQILVLHGFDFSLESPHGGRTRFLIVFDS
jgi:signal transduction histidine kinase